MIEYLLSFIDQIDGDVWIYYYGNISLGTPRRTYKVLFDSNSSYLWISSFQCGPFNIPCWQSERYDNRMSITYIKEGLDFEFVYYTAHCRGYTSREDVTVGIASLRKQLFGEMVDQPGLVFFNSKFDGVFGLGTPKDLNSWPDTTVLQSMVRQKEVRYKIFCIYLNRDSLEDVDAELTLGGCRNNYHIEDFKYVPAVSQEMWMVNMDGISSSFEQRDLFFNYSMRALVDSRTSLIVLPEPLYSHIFSWLTQIDVLYYGMVNCSDISNLPILIFNIDGQSFSLEGEYYVTQIHNNTLNTTECTVAFDSTKNDWGILGEVFMRRYYTMFDGDNMRIGFASALKANT